MSFVEGMHLGMHFHISLDYKEASHQILYVA